MRSETWEVYNVFGVPYALLPGRTQEKRHISVLLEKHIEENETSHYGNREGIDKETEDCHTKERKNSFLPTC